MSKKGGQILFVIPRGAILFLFCLFPPFSWSIRADSDFFWGWGVSLNGDDDGDDGSNNCHLG